MRSALSAVLVSATLGAAQSTPPVKVSIESGVLVGESKNGVNSFKGIPFAKPPVGALRWQPPQTIEKWSGDRAATEFKLPCPQPTNADGKTPNGGGVSGATAEVVKSKTLPNGPTSTTARQ